MSEGMINTLIPVLCIQCGPGLRSGQVTLSRDRGVSWVLFLVLLHFYVSVGNLTHSETLLGFVVSVCVCLLESYNTNWDDCGNLKGAFEGPTGGFERFSPLTADYI